MAWRGGPGSGADTRVEILLTTGALRAELGDWPSPKEIATRLGLPRSTLRYHNAILEAGGWIRRPYRGHRVEIIRDVPATLDEYRAACGARSVYP